MKLDFFAHDCGCIASESSEIQSYFFFVAKFLQLTGHSKLAGMTYCYCIILIICNKIVVFTLVRT